MTAMNILIADDYDDNRELLRLLLESSGHVASEARDGRECVALACRELPDLVLIDLSMPKLDGWETLRELRADERTRHIPCAALTAFASVQDRRRALQAGFDGYLAKPFRASELHELVGRLLANALTKDRKSFSPEAKLIREVDNAEE